ncbi:MAG: PTS sugar transporter subunit IIB [Erysipelotrichaceae bacterium]
MVNVVLCRVDSRLIHGQVMTKWIQQSQANRIVIISEVVSKDTFLLEIYKMSSPPGVRIDCYSEADAVVKWKDGTLDQGKILLLFPDIKTLNRACEAGISIEMVQIGGLGGGPSRKVVYQNITLDEEDSLILKNLQEKNIDIYFQTIPEDNPLKLKDALDRFNR